MIHDDVWDDNPPDPWPPDDEQGEDDEEFGDVFNAYGDDGACEGEGVLTGKLVAHSRVTIIDENGHANGNRKPKKRRRTYMGYLLKLDRDFVDIGMAMLKTASAKVVWQVLRRHIDSETRTITLSQQVIARKGNLAIRTVNAAIKTLVAASLLKVLKQGGRHLDEGGNFHNVTTTYRLYGKPQRRGK